MSYFIAQLAQTITESVRPITDISTQMQMPERILLVDDNPSIRRFFYDCLAETYACHEASCAQEAITRLAEDEFALVILDVMMPGMSGIELLQKIIKNSPDTAVIMASGINNPQLALESKQLGAFDYLIKPCSVELLELTVRHALEKRRLLLDVEQYKFEIECRNQELTRQKFAYENLRQQFISSEKLTSLGKLTAGIMYELSNSVMFIDKNLDFFKQNFNQLCELLDYYDNSQFYDDAQLPAVFLREVSEIKEKIQYHSLLPNLNSVITDCYEGTFYISEIVKSLRSFSHSDKPKFTKTCINKSLSLSIALLSHYYNAGNIAIVYNQKHLPKINGCVGQLNQVWINLLLNATQAVEKDGTGQVIVETDILTEFISVKISDNGSGIAPENLDKIFEPFFTTKLIGEGDGLGLSTTAAIIKQHRGTINVESNFGKGTTFTVKLPVENCTLADAKI